MAGEPAIALESLIVGFPTDGDGWRPAVDRVTLAIAPGERVGLVGESGSGKSLTALACLGVIPEPGRMMGGSVTVSGVDVSGMSEAELVRLRGHEIGIIFQEAAEALNPVFTIGFQVAETIAVHRGLGRRESTAEAMSLLETATLARPHEIARAYPHQLSGGEAQRVMLALALAGKPRTLIADEPTSALDTLTQTAVLELLDRLVVGDKMALLLISHDLAVVEGVVERIAVMFAGQIVEEGPTETVFGETLHPYTSLLLSSAPGRRRSGDGSAARHDPRDRRPIDQGCRFAGRCHLVREACRETEPQLVEHSPGHRVRCPVVLSRLGTHHDGG